MTIVQLPVDKDLSLRNVSGKIGNGVSDIYRNRELIPYTFLKIGPAWELTVVWHGQDGDLCDRSVSSLDTTCTLINRGQVRVHVTRVATSTGDLFTGGGYLSRQSNRDGISSDPLHTDLS